MSFLSHYRCFFFLLHLLIINGSEDLKRYSVNIQLNEFNGTIIGKEMYDWMNETFIGFLGIPYAKAPLNELRFRDPQKLDNFNGNYEALYDGYECPSITALNQSEDCLYLNVFTKNISRALPVLVVIHPGGLYIQSGSSYFMKPNYLLSKDIVLVTFNYRLGTLGFLNLGTKSIPGNAGLKDQVFALRWVQKFITYFGGDPDNVTLMGYSAGALSVCLHLVSPMSQNLFSKAIIMSGSLPPQTQLPQGEQRYLALRQAHILNCSFLSRNYSSQDLESNLLNCFKEYQGYEIANTLRKMFDFGKDNPIYLWLPIIEQDFQQERFLAQDFYTLLKQPNNTKVNRLLIGYTNGEFCESAANILMNSSLTETLQKNYEYYLPKIFMYERQERFFKNFTKKIIQHYLPNNLYLLGHEHYDNLCDLFSDSLIRFGAHHLAELLTNHHTPVYFYEFTYTPNQHQHKYEKNFPNKKVRVEHMDDFHYLFNDMPKTLLKPEVVKTINIYVQFIYDFITNGNAAFNYAKTYPQSYAYIDGLGITYKSGHNFANLPFWSNLLEDIH